MLSFLVLKAAAAQHENILAAATKRGCTGAHLAARGGHLNVLTFLVDQVGDDILSIRDSDGWLSAHSAAMGGHVEAVRYIASKLPMTALLDSTPRPLPPTLEVIAVCHGHRAVLNLARELTAAATVPVQVSSDRDKRWGWGHPRIKPMPISSTPVGDGVRSTPSDFLFRLVVQC